MAFQNSQNNSNFPIILYGNAMLKKDQTILTDGSRTVDLVKGTVMAQVAATKKWVPWTAVTGTDGSAFPLGILISDTVAFATYAAGDVTGVTILTGGAGVGVDTNLLVFDKGSTGGGTALTLDTVFSGNAVGSGTATAYFIMRAEKFLNMLGIFPTDSVAFDNTEN